MSMKLYYHPRSTYSQKALLAFYEKDVPFEREIITFGSPELKKLTPIGKLPVLMLDGGHKIPEATIIIEYLDSYFERGPRLIPGERDLGRQTRFYDRIGDLYVNESVSQIYFDSMKPAEHRNGELMKSLHARLDAMFTGYDEHLSQRTWVMGETFTMADCALIPSLGYARMLHPFDRWKNLSAYANRAFERPSFLKVREDLAPYLEKPALNYAS